MDLYSPDRALPIHGAAGLLMGAAVANEGIPLSLSELGRRAGISKFAARRAGQKLREAGFLDNRPGGWTFNGEHELADLAREVMWTLLGACRALESEGVRAGDEDYWTDVPLSLRAAPPSSRALGEQPGVAAPAQGLLDLPAPTALEVRVLVKTLAQPLNRIAKLEDRSDDVCCWWGQGRARDWIRVIGALGGAGARAFNELSTAAATHPLVEGEWLLPHEPVPPESWLRAAFWLDAELRQVNNVLLRLDAPGPDDFGRLGDQLVAAEVRDVAEGLLDVSESLVAHECMQAWMATSPKAAKYPFLTEICPAPKGNLPGGKSPLAR